MKNPYGHKVVECWKCGRDVRVTDAGALFMHRVGRRWTSPFPMPVCPASGTSEAHERRRDRERANM